MKKERIIKSRLKEVMEDRGFSVRRLESASGVANPTITKARKDEGMALMSIRVLSHLADALGCSVKDLFDDLPDEFTKKDAE